MPAARPEPPANPYTVLGVATNATEQEIKQAWRRQARRYHPDVSKAPDAEARFKALADAHRLLKDPARRAAYDRGEPDPETHPGFHQPPPQRSTRPSQRAQRRPAGRGPSIDEDFFSGTQGDSASELLEALLRQHQQATPPQDQTAELQISVEEACTGGHRLVQLQGHHHSGQSDGLRELDVTIPPGMADGQRLRLAGQAGVDALGRHGDVVLTVHLQPHPLFSVQGRDISLQLPVTPWEAALGAQVTLPTPTGSLTLTVPPDSPGGRRLRLSGRGIPGKPAGDLYAVLQLVLPRADTPDARAAYAEFARQLPFDARPAWAH